MTELKNNDHRSDSKLVADEKIITNFTAEFELFTKIVKIRKKMFKEILMSLQDFTEQKKSELLEE